jgi:S-adenosyl-L-methionine hydrolase (adenosine-forming)
MPIITLTSDWGLTDYTAAAVKGHILTRMPEATIVDITHKINPFDTNMAAFIIRHAYQNFPEGSIHIIGVNTTESKSHKHILFQLNNHYFIGADNGIPALIVAEGKPQQIIELSVPLDSYLFTFSERDLFAKVAIHLAQGQPVNELGTPINSLTEASWIMPQESPDRLVATIIYADNYGNIVTNITEDFFRKNCKGKKFEINLQVGVKLTTISNSYEDVPKNSFVALFNSDGHLEIAMNQGNLFQLFNYEINATIIINIE